MDRKQTIHKVLNELIEQDYRRGFEDGVIYRVRTALNDLDGSGREFWNVMLTPGFRNVAFTKFFGWDLDLWDLYFYADEMSKGEGAFVLDPRDTYGT